jgi:hypothetical protein
MTDRGCRCSPVSVVTNAEKAVAQVAEGRSLQAAAPCTKAVPLLVKGPPQGRSQKRGRLRGHGRSRRSVTSSASSRTILTPKAGMSRAWLTPVGHQDDHVARPQ